MNRRMLAIVALALALGLLAVGTVAAGGATRTPVTGTRQLLEIWGEPERYWEPGPQWGFWKGNPFFDTVTTSDPRVNGIGCSHHTGLYRPSPDDPWGASEGQMWWSYRLVPGRDPNSPDCSNAVDYWEGTCIGDRAPDGNEYSRCNLKGYGAWAGLKLRWEAWSGSPDATQPFRIVGEILDPAGK